MANYDQYCWNPFLANCEVMWEPLSVAAMIGLGIAALLVSRQARDIANSTRQARASAARTISRVACRDAYFMVGCAKAILEARPSDDRATWAALRLIATLDERDTATALAFADGLEDQALETVTAGLDQIKVAKNGAVTTLELIDDGVRINRVAEAIDKSFVKIRDAYLLLLDDKADDVAPRIAEFRTDVPSPRG